MATLLSTLVAAALVNNLFYVQLLGVSPLLVGSRRLENISELAVFGGLLLFLTSCLNLLIYRWILKPLGLEGITLIGFMACSVLLAIGMIQWLEQKLPLTARRQRLAIGLFGSSSAVIGSSLTASSSQLSDLLIIVSCAGTALGFALALLAFAALRQRIEVSDTPEAFRGAPLDLISAGLASMCFLAMSGPG
ncbi:MAG: hypothetical protein OXE78_00390 [Gammaproteobacteria bacterium]|nr:hypothetical protein [Gammaproteobacteria bacterium]MCY4357058.1 hypothetical protein [Gammaproteobacteria bacterium]